MAPKRFAPPPPVESLEEGSCTDESEEEIALSPPSVTPKYRAPLPPKVEQPESSDDEEEEEEDIKPNHLPHSSAAAQNPPPPPPHRELSESDEEEEEETDDEAPQPVHAPKQEAEGEGVMPPPRGDEKPAAHIQRSLSKDDEVRILEVLAAHRRESGMLPQPEELEAALAGSLDISYYGRKELMTKLKTLKTSYTKAVGKGKLLIKDRDRRFFDLCKEVWGGGNMPANGTVPRDFDEVCQMYPILADEVKVLERKQPGLFKRAFTMIDDEKARTLDQKIKKQRVSQMKVQLRRSKLTLEVTEILIGLVE